MPARLDLVADTPKLQLQVSDILAGRGTEEDALQGRYEHAASAAGR